MGYNKAQNFIVDSSLFVGESYISVPQVDLYFQAKPDANNNASGIQNPGISVVIVSTTNHIPNLSDIQNLQSCITRIEYQDVIVSNDASLVTTVVFAQPFLLLVGGEYSIILSYDGNENFVLWEDLVGHPIVKPIPAAANGAIGNTTSTETSTGAGCLYVGPAFTGSTVVPSSPQNASNGTITTPTLTPVTNSITSLPIQNSTSWSIEPSNACWKFAAYYSSYNSNGQVITVNTTINTTINSVTTNNVTSYEGTTITGSFCETLIPSLKMEYISWDPKVSFGYSMLIGDRFWQDHPFWCNPSLPYPVGAVNGWVWDWGVPSFFPGPYSPIYTLGCVLNSTVLTCGLAAYGLIPDFTQLFFGGPDEEFITLHSLNHDGPGLDRLFCGQIVSFNSTVIVVDKPLTFSNIACFFYKSPVATLYFSGLDNFDVGNNNLLYLRDSNANNSHRFKDYCIDHYHSNVISAGIGYSNSDHIEITGFEYYPCAIQGNFKAYANLITDSSGRVVSIHWTNTGCGFLTPGQCITNFVTYLGGVSPGVGCNLNLFIDSIYRNERRNGITLDPCRYHSCKLIHLPVDILRPELFVTQPSSAAYTATHQLAYYRIPSIRSRDGWEYYCYDDPFPFAIQHDIECVPPYRYQPIMPCRSKEFIVVTPTCQPAINVTITTTQYFANCSNAGLISVNSVCTAANTNVAVDPSQTYTIFYRYLINDDYTGENTNYGNATSKQIESMVTFANNQFAEDLKVWIDCYRPVGTDFKIYAKIYNTADSDTFDEKDWTLLLDNPTNIGLNSPGITFQASNGALVELGYGFYQTPNSEPTSNTTTYLAGSANVTNSGYSNLVGSGTTWQTNATANITTGDLIKFYQPLFSNVFQISVVTNVVNNTLITISDPVVNNNFLGTPLHVDVLQYPHQAFNNQLNDNIVRYYNTSMVPFDTFNVMQLKMVFLSTIGNTAANTQEYVPGVPYISDIRSVAVSA